MTGGEGDDTLNGALATVDLYLDGGAGNDKLTGGTAKNTLIGGDGDDVLTGKGDEDTLDGGSGVDTLNGAGGNDTYLFDTSFGEDRFRDMQGNTVLDLSGVTSDLVVDINNSGIKISTAEEELRVGRSIVVKIILGTGNDKVFLRDLPERTIEIEDTGGANTNQFELGRQSSTKADGTILITDSDSAFDEIILNNIPGIVTNDALPDILTFNDHEIVNGREIIQFTDGVEQVTLPVQESEIDTESVTTFYYRDLTIASDTLAGAVLGTVDVVVDARNLKVLPAFSGHSFIIDVEEDVILDNTLHLTGDFDINADSIGNSATITHANPDVSARSLIVLMPMTLTGSSGRQSRG